MEENKLNEEFLTLFEQNMGMIIKISRAYTKTKEDREDLINDIAIELWKSLKNFKGNSKVSTWVYRVVLNTSMNFKRKRTKNKITLFNDVEQISHQSIAIAQEGSSNSRILHECINQLPDINKAIILLYLEGKSHLEISNITGISKTNVTTRMSRIKELLKNLTIKKNK